MNEDDAGTPGCIYIATRSPLLISMFIGWINSLESELNGGKINELVIRLGAFNTYICRYGGSGTGLAVIR